jgi:hypothetical protein
MSAKAYSTKGLKIWFGDAIVTTVTPTAITKAKPAVVTAAAMTVVNGDVAYMASTGFPELDGKYFTIGAATATSMTLLGSNTTSSAGTLAATPKIEVTEKTDLIDLGCLAKTIVFNSDAPASIAAGTYCDPSLAIASPIRPPSTIEITGNINIADPAYKELLDGVDDGLTRVVDIVLPFGQGDIIAPSVTTVVNWDLPVDGVQGFSATMSCTTAPAHRF